MHGMAYGWEEGMRRWEAMRCDGMRCAVAIANPIPSPARHAMHTGDEKDVEAYTHETAGIW